jgi:serine/threonine protein kinase
MKACFPKPGDVFEERYHIDGVIGAGGFAKVYRATQVELERVVALKILRPNFDEVRRVGDDNSYTNNTVERFKREAKLVSQLIDPHTITMHDYGQTTAGLLYMVFEFIDGLPLSELVAQEGALAADRVVKIVNQILNSLEEAHALGVLHRDLKPANVMIFDHLSRKDQVKLLDFGIAKHVLSDNTSEDLTTAGTIIGTPRYMSPEQIRDEKLGPPSDIYSLGLLAYEMLVGDKAITAETSIKIIGRQLDSKSVQIPASAGVPPGLTSMVNLMLRKDAQQRFQSTSELRKAIKYWDATPGDEARRIAIDTTQPGPARIELLTELDLIEVDKPASSVQPKTPSRRTLGAIAAALLLIIAGTVAFILLPGSTDEESAANQLRRQAHSGDDETPDKAESGQGDPAVKNSPLGVEVAPLGVAGKPTKSNTASPPDQPPQTGLDDDDEPKVDPEPKPEPEPNVDPEPEPEPKVDPEPESESGGEGFPALDDL